MEQREKLRKYFFVIGLFIVFSFIINIYKTSTSVKGYESTKAICVSEEKYYSDQTALYRREYHYFVDDEEYEINDVSVNKKACKTIKYNPENPLEARICNVANFNSLFTFLIGLILMVVSYLVKFESFRKKMSEVKEKILKISRRNIIRIVDIAFYSYMLIALISIFRGGFFDIDWNEARMQYSQMEIIIECITFIIGSIILKNLLVILMYLGIKLGIKRFKKDKLSAIDLKKYDGYYREILKEYSPAELSYIDNFEISIKNDIVATLLSLELHNKISLDEKENKIIVKDSSYDGLSRNEIYVLDNIKDGKLNSLDENEFSNKLKEDAIRNGLLKESKIGFKNFIKKLLLNIALEVLSIFMCAFIFKNIIDNPNNVSDVKLLLFVFFILLSGYLPFYIFIYFSIYLAKSRNNNYNRTKDGEAINERLEGLRNYLKDYSFMNEKDEESLVLWEDYLIYSVVFNENNKAVRNIWDKYISI